MTRKNRKKLHRQLRLRAEARDQARAEARRYRALELERSQRLVQAALARPTAARPAQAQVAARAIDPTIEHLLRMMRAPSRVAKRVRVLWRAMRDQAGASSPLSFLLLLARQPWVRHPDSWVPKKGDAKAKQLGLVRHLLVKYDVPDFLIAAPLVREHHLARTPVEDEWATRVLVHLAGGGSLRALVGTECLPAPLTRRMCHLFVASRAKTAIAALREAQVVAFGGSKALVRALLRSRLGALRGANADVGEPFWHRVIQWLAGARQLPADLDCVLGWIERQRRAGLAEGREVKVWMRSVANVVKDAVAWRCMEAGDRRDLPRSGLVVGALGAGWSVVELHHPALLADEATAMSHCADQYRALIATHKTALFSLRLGGHRRVTVEVSLGAGAVVQVAGKANRSPCAAELKAVGMWAKRNRLVVHLAG